MAFTFSCYRKNVVSQLMRAFLFFYHYNRSCHGTWRSVFVEIRFNATLFTIRIPVRSDGYTCIITEPYETKNLRSARQLCRRCLNTWFRTFLEPSYLFLFSCKVPTANQGRIIGLALRVLEDIGCSVIGQNSTKTQEGAVKARFEEAMTPLNMLGLGI